MACWILQEIMLTKKLPGE